MLTPEVSVLMSCHNASRWLREAADSVLAQTYREFEFIIVDDGSSDESRDIIEDYRKHDPRIVALFKPHTGLADSLNIGIMRARGRWIARLDADDFSEPRRLDEQMRFATRNPDVVLIGTSFLQTDEHGGSARKIPCPRTHERLIRNLERLRRFFPHSSAFFRRDMARDVGCYNPWIQRSQDFDLWLRLGERGRIACLREYLVRCRIHAGQISNTRPSGTSQLIYATASAICHFLRLSGRMDPSRGTDEAAWQELLLWVDQRVAEEGIPERHRAWFEVRAAYFGRRHRVAGAISFAVRLAGSGHSTALLKEKLVGLDLPERLAKEWMHRRIP